MRDKKITKVTFLPEISALKDGTKPKKKVAAYARVSTLSEEQDTSFIAQKDY